VSIILSAAATLALSIQAGQQPTKPAHPTVVRDSGPAASMRRAVTAELLRTAFLDDPARQLVARARRERFAQDSSLKSYEALGRQRLTVSAGIGAGLQRTAYRVESAFHIRWRDSVGAEVQLTGARVGVPLIREAEQEVLENEVRNPELSPIPYSRGQEALWPMSGAPRGPVDDRLVHPLGPGAESYYTYQSGDTTRIRLPDGRALVLRELKVRPRSPQSNVAVGSLWFDDATGQLVRAAYRLAAPITLNLRTPTTILGSATDPSPIAMTIVKGLVSPFKIEISGVTVEYGMYQGRYWLPKSRSLEAKGQVSFAKVAVEIEQSFTYPTINGPALVQVVINEPAVDPVTVPDSLTGERLRAWRDSVRRAAVTTYGARIKAFEDSLRNAPCDSTGYRLMARVRADIALPVALRYPCDVSALATSPDFTGPLYAANDDVLDTKLRDDMLARALPIGAQAAMTLDALPRPDLQYGLSMTRYNRIEGLSSGIHVEQQLGAGYVTGLTGRIGTADHEPNGDLSFARTSLRTTIMLRGYNRLVVANDWGNPLSFGSSVSALLFGRDEGFYYRASGAELTWTSERGTQVNWRLFAEQERTARQHTDYTWGASFVPNIEAATGSFAGADVRWLHTTGVDPRGLRTITNLRLEAAAGDSTYGRGALDVTLMRALGGRLSGALTLSSGSSVGALPAQRRWFLGGTQTVRGQSADTAQNGNAFWMTRGELASEQKGYRVALFSDLGWVGDRSAISSIGRPLSGAGVGFSGFDGLIRLDVARGFSPRKQTRIAFYFGGKF
jgi:hypothetical protein